MMNNENGRSMVEMLGVLAIIGVLSVAGIGGYSMAMKKYRVNEILNTASQLVILAQAKEGGNGSTATMSDLGVDEVVSYKLKADCTSTTVSANGGKCKVTAESGDTGDNSAWAAAVTEATAGGYFTLGTAAPAPETTS